MVIRFARFAHATDGRHEIPPQGVYCARRQRPTPYLYTENEIQALMAQALHLGPPGTLRAQTYSTLIGLLAATGLRISEAISLHFQDISADGLVIRNTKFKKSRLVPLHSTTQAALERYLVERRRVATNDDHMFLSTQLGPLSLDAVYPDLPESPANVVEFWTVGRRRPSHSGDWPTSMRSHFPPGILAPRPVSLRHSCSWA
jgi:integrase/recombinase XerD